jgi:hypothetical protein
VDTYVARETEAAVERCCPPAASAAAAAAAPSSAAPHRVFYSHETKPGRLVAVQRMAHVAGVAHLDERCHLSIHPKFGPWFALRAVVVLDDVEGPPDAAKPSPVGNPLAADNGARDRVDTAVEHALAGYELKGGADKAGGSLHQSSPFIHQPPHQAVSLNLREKIPGTTGLLSSADESTREWCTGARQRVPCGEATQWQRWVDVRDAVQPGHKHRYYDDQMLYHYTREGFGGVTNVKRASLGALTHPERTAQVSERVR